MRFSAYMGCGGNWLSSLNRTKKTKLGGRRWPKWSSKKAKLNGIVEISSTSSKKSSTIFDDATYDDNGNCWVHGHRIEDVAATKIQTSFRAFRARKIMQEQRGIVRLQNILAQCNSMEMQTVSALNYFHRYSEIQDRIKSRRLCMVLESQLRQKKIENQLKVDAKLQEVKTQWSCTPKSMDELKAKIHTREEAAAKRERAMSYAFNHQWRANASVKQLTGDPELGKAEWGWSWMERWIAARPWESPAIGTLETEPTSPTFTIKITKNKVSKTPIKLSSPKATSSKGSMPKRVLSSGKRLVKSQRKLSSPTLNKTAAKKNIRVETETTKSMKIQEPETLTSN